uniref:Envelope glycoprotein gH n=1 Tax=Otarine gammaherpesvirus 4 TaxID=2801541 RepID=A0A8B6T2V2_9GAMA|nr:Envelope glycoprotein gH [Otarine gammaherpesvirus 4]
MNAPTMHFISLCAAHMRCNTFIIYHIAVTTVLIITQFYHVDSVPNVYATPHGVGIRVSILGHISSDGQQLPALDFVLDWARVQSILKYHNLSHIWVETNATEDLTVTLHRRSSVHRVAEPPVPLQVGNEWGHESSLAAKSNPGDVHVSISHALASNAGGLGYDGRLAVPAYLVWLELFRYTERVVEAYTQDMKLLYSVRDRVTQLAVSARGGAYQLMGAATRNFAYVLIASNIESNNANFAALFFGDRNRLPVLRGAVTRDELLVAQNAHHAIALLVAARYYDVGSVAVGRLNFTNLFTVAAQEDLVSLMQYLQNRILALEVSGSCANSDFSVEFFGLFFQAIIAHYRIGAELYKIGDRGDASFRWLIDHLFEASILRVLLHHCIPGMYTRGFYTAGIYRLAKNVAQRVPANAVGMMSRSDIEWILRLFHMADQTIDAVRSNANVLAAIAYGVYERYATAGFQLHDKDRRLMMLMYFAMRFDAGSESVIDSPKIKFVETVVTSMCSASEIAYMISKLSTTRADELTMSTTFSPCFMSMRFDFTRNKLWQETMQTSNLTRAQTADGVSGLFNVIVAEHVGVPRKLPEAHCLHNADDVQMVVSLQNVTYIVASGTLTVGIVYNVAHTFLKSSLTVAAIRAQDCLNKRHNAIPQVHDVRIVYNLTVPARGCVYCGSAVLSYDEVAGVQSVAYVSSEAVQRVLFAKNSPFFDTQNMHTHYLLLLNNGTVVEMRGTYRQRAIGWLVLSLTFIAICLCIYCIYKLMVALC